MEYLSIPIKTLLDNFQAPCDFYIKISESKFLKFIHENDFYEEDLILKYLFRSVKECYIRQDDQEKFKKHFSDKLRYELEKVPILGAPAEKILEKAYERVREYALKLDLPEETIEFVTSVQDQSIKLIKNSNKDIFELICRKISRKNYLADHSLMVSMTSCAVAIKMSWSTQATLSKFVMASLFHDISLEDDRLARIRSVSEAQLSKMNKEEIDIIMNHPVSSRDIFLATKISCPNADKIIQCHHELPDGSGFPSGLDAFAIPPYVCLFILSEEFVSTMIRHEFSTQAWQEIKQRFNESYSKGNFRKPIKGFQATFKPLL